MLGMLSTQLDPSTWSKWSKWPVNSDKKLNVNKPCMTSRKTTFRLQRWHQSNIKSK